MKIVKDVTPNGHSNRNATESPQTHVISHTEFLLLQLLQIAEATGRIVVKIPPGDPRGMVFLFDKDRLPLLELADWSQRADADLIILSEKGTGGIVVYAPQNSG